MYLIRNIFFAISNAINTVSVFMDSNKKSCRIASAAGR
jgi:hypothetical protein